MRTWYNEVGKVAKHGGFVSEILLPFARHVPTGRTVAPEEVTSGNACECECLFCDAPVQARHCTSKANHFAHQPKVVDDDQPCPASFERCVFWMAKRILEEGSELALPEYTLTLTDSRYDLQQSYPITKASTQAYVLVDFPDITAAGGDLVSITVNLSGHPLRLIISYNAYVVRAREPSIHISLDYLKRMYKQQKQGFLLAMRELLLESVVAKEWLFHSEEREGKCEKHFQTLVERENAEREAKKEARQREAERVLALRQRQPDSSYAARATRRLQELVRIAHRAASQGRCSGWQCRACFVVSCARPIKCVHCGSTQFAGFDFSQENMVSIYNKFYCANYAGRSLEAAPRLRSDP